MKVAHEKLPGLDRERVLAAIEPVLSAHGVDVVELIWRTDRGGWVLELNIEQPGSKLPGAGVTIDLCSEISRDVSAALDVADVIPHRYRLDVGSPGLERALYGAADFERFEGKLARLKLHEPHAGQHVLHGTLRGFDAQARVLLEDQRGELVPLVLENIGNARLVFQMGGESRRKPSTRRASSRAPKAGRHGGRAS